MHVVVRGVVNLEGFQDYNLWGPNEEYGRRMKCNFKLNKRTKG
jgi:hypothetical protein